MMNDAPESADPADEAPLQDTLDALSQIEDLKKKLAAAEKAASDAKDAQVRAVAEAENVRKRAEREVASASKFGAERVFSDLLGVADSLELGLKAAAEPDAKAEALAEGMDLTWKQLESLLSKHGVHQVNPEKEAFNPDFHEAMSMVESAEVAPNHVLNVVQKGYRLHERLLRPAMVIVARAPAPKDPEAGA